MNANHIRFRNELLRQSVDAGFTWHGRISSSGVPSIKFDVEYPPSAGVVIFPMVGYWFAILATPANPHPRDRKLVKLGAPLPDVASRLSNALVDATSAIVKAEPITEHKAALSFISVVESLIRVIPDEQDADDYAFWASKLRTPLDLAVRFTP